MRGARRNLESAIVPEVLEPLSRALSAPDYKRIGLYDEDVGYASTLTEVTMAGNTIATTPLNAHPADEVRSLTQEDGILHVRIADSSTARQLAIRRQSGLTGIFCGDTTAVVMPPRERKQGVTSINLFGFAACRTFESKISSRLFIPQNRQADTSDWLRNIIAL